MMLPDWHANEAGFWDKFNAKFDQINRSTIIVRADDSLVGGIRAYKVYVNGFIHYHTPHRFSGVAPANSVYIWVAAGTYRMVVREYDARKPSRLESNPVELTLRDDEEVTLWVRLQGGQIVLSTAWC